MDRKELLNFIYKLVEEIKDQQVLKTLITRDEIAMLLSFYHELVNNTPLSEQKEGKNKILSQDSKITLQESKVADFSKYVAKDTPLESYINIIGEACINLKCFEAGINYELNKDLRYKVIEKTIKQIENATEGIKLLRGLEYEKEGKDSIV